jgi:TP901 family phage tail tape measure protein
MADDQVTILALLQDRVSKPLKNIGTETQRTFRKIRNVGRQLTAPFRVAQGVLTRVTRSLTSLRAVATGAIGVGIVREFVRFEDSLAQVATLVDTNLVSIDKLGLGVRRLARDTGESVTVLNKALFDAISAGINAGKSVEFLGTATRLAAGGATDTAAATRGLVSILNAYGLGAEFAADVSDSLFTAMKQGVTTVAQLAANVGKIAPIARIAGLSFDEMNAALAALTKSGLSTEQAATALRAVLVGLIKPSEAATKLAEELGINLSTSAIAGGKFAEFLVDVANKTGLSEQKLAVLFDDVRSFAGVANLAADGARNLRDGLDEMARKAGATDEAFRKVERTLGFRLRRLLRSVQDLAIQIGEAAAPVLKEISDGLAAFVGRISSARNEVNATVREIIELAKRYFSILRTIIEEGDLVTFVLNALKASAVHIADVLIAALPLLLRTVALIGQEIGVALVRSFIGSTIAELGKVIGTSGKSSFIGETLGRLGAEFLAPDEFEKLKNFVQELENAEQLIKRIEEFEKLSLEEQAKRFAGGRRGRSGSPVPLGETVETIRARIAELERELGATRIGKRTLEQARSELKDAAAGFLQDVERSAKAQVGTLAQGLSPAVQKALDDLAQFAAGRAGRIAEAKKTDTANAVFGPIIDEGKRLFDAAVSQFPEVLRGAFSKVRQLQDFSRGRGTPGEQVSIVGTPELSLEDAEAAADSVLAKLDRLKDIRLRIAQQLEGGFISSGEGLIRDEEALADLEQAIDDALGKFPDYELDATSALGQIQAKLLELKRDLGKSDEEQGNFFTGFGAGVRGAVASLDTLREVGVAAGALLVDSLSQVVDTLAAGEKIGRKFLSTLLRAAAAIAFKAGLAGLFSAEAHHGGLVPDRIPRFAGGGQVLSPGSEHRDSILALLRRREFVIPPESVDHYGTGVFEALRRRLVPRDVFAGIKTATPRMVAFRRAFATGGPVGPAAPTAGVGTVRAFVANNEAEASRILSAGNGSVFQRMLRKYSPDARPYGRGGKG